MAWSVRHTAGHKAFWPLSILFLFDALVLVCSAVGFVYLIGLRTVRIRVRPYKYGKNTGTGSINTCRTCINSDAVRYGTVTVQPYTVIWLYVDELTRQALPTGIYTPPYMSTCKLFCYQRQDMYSFALVNVKRFRSLGGRKDFNALI
jgi:hypothetical protein